jgi:hypothetical protein
VRLRDKVEDTVMLPRKTCVSEKGKTYRSAKYSDPSERSLTATQISSMSSPCPTLRSTASSSASRVAASYGARQYTPESVMTLAGGDIVLFGCQSYTCEWPGEEGVAV